MKIDEKFIEKTRKLAGEGKIDVTPDVEKDMMFHDRPKITRKILQEAL